jgi:L-alanine-DL-glutamate epimerase-like enolase superfamily enzyme
MTVADTKGQRAQGWGETPLSVQWVWPSTISYQERCDAMQTFCRSLTDSWADFTGHGHPMEVGHRFIETALPRLLKKLNASRGAKAEPMPWLAALVCCSPFDIALHDAYGQLLNRPTYSTYTREFMNDDLAHFLEPAAGAKVSFHDKYPADFLNFPPAQRLPAWHLVGGKDLIDPAELTGNEPKDGYPVLLADWIERDRLTCLKVKLRGNDAKWDYERLVKVGQIGIEHNVRWLTSDFNSTVTEPAYVNEILDRLVLEYPRIYGMMLYVEQPFPYDLEKNQIDVHSVSARKPLFMDESAHDWRLIRLGRQLGWTGVALKTCKTQTGALLSLCWAKAHGMTLMVQDLTNPMLAQIPHVLLAAHAGTIMGVETNAMQFYPAASAPEEAVHPGLYRRRDGQVDLSTLRGPGFGYRLDEIKRQLPEKAAGFKK